MRLQSALVICHLVSDLRYISIKAQSHISDPGLKVSFKGTINPQSTSRFSTANMKSKFTLITSILHVPGFIVTDSLVHIIPTKNKKTFLMTSTLILQLEQIHNCFVQKSKLLLLFCSIYNVNFVCCMEYPNDIQHLLKCAVFMLGICKYLI